MKLPSFSYNLIKITLKTCENNFRVWESKILYFDKNFKMEKIKKVKIEEQEEIFKD